MRWPSACPASPSRRFGLQLASSAPSYVLRALGLEDSLARRALRITQGRYTGAAEVDYLLQGVRSSLS